MCRVPVNYHELQAAYIYLHNENKRLDKELSETKEKCSRLIKDVCEIKKAADEYGVLSGRLIKKHEEEKRVCEILLWATWGIMIALMLLREYLS